MYYNNRCTFIFNLEKQLVSADDTNKLHTALTESLQSNNNKNKVSREQDAEDDDDDEEEEDDEDFVEEKHTPVDWKPQENCYFCVDGKLITVNEKGDPVAESGPVSAEAEIANKVSKLLILDRELYL